MTVTIYHNPDCGTSRNALAMIRQSGEEPVVIEYLKHPPDRARLLELINAMAIPVRALLREKGTPYVELGLGDSKYQSAHRGDAEGHPALPSIGSGARPAGQSRGRNADFGITRICRVPDHAAQPALRLGIDMRPERRSANMWSRPSLAVGGDR
jgi:arsenate reductase (glutaredoxin)